MMKNKPGLFQKRRAAYFTRIPPLGGIRASLALIGIAILGLCNSQEDYLIQEPSRAANVVRLDVIGSIDWRPKISFAPWEKSLLVEQGEGTDLLVLGRKAIQEKHLLPFKFSTISFSEDGKLRSSDESEELIDAKEFGTNLVVQEESLERYELSWKNGSRFQAMEEGFQKGRIKSYYIQDKDIVRINGDELFCEIKGKKVQLNIPGSKILTAEVDPQTMMALISETGGSGSSSISYYLVDLESGTRFEALSGYQKDSAAKISTSRKFRLFPGKQLLVMAVFEGPLDDHFGEKNLKRVVLCNYEGEEIELLEADCPKDAEDLYVEFSGDFLAISAGGNKVLPFHVVESMREE